MLGHREIGERVLELLAGIDPESPSADEELVAESLQRYLQALGLPRRNVHIATDVRALRWSRVAGGVWPAFSARQWRLLDEAASTGRRWVAGAGWQLPDPPVTEPPRPELARLLQSDSFVLGLGLGGSPYVKPVRRVTWGLDRIARVLTSGSTMTPPKRVDALVALAEAAAAGLFAHVVGARGDLVALVRPRMRFDTDGRLHNWDGRPAAEWPNGKGLYFWHGVEMTESAGRDPDAVTPSRVLGWTNVERRRVAIERIGLQCFMTSVGAQVVQEDDYGRLWRTEREIDGEHFVAVEVVNSTPEPDGSYKRYFLRVPPATRTARRGVAWSFGLTRKVYAPAVES